MALPPIGCSSKLSEKAMALAHHLQQLTGNSGDLGADAITGSGELTRC